MKTTILKLALGAAVIGQLAVTAPARAGDYSDGGLKGMRGSHVPVPAPEPIPDYRARWYLRADVGAGFGVGMSTTESGMRYGDNDLGLGVNALNGPFGIGAPEFLSLFSDKGDEIGHMYGVGIGYYFSPNFRMDITADIRSEKKNRLTGHFEYERDNGLMVHGDVTDTTTYRSSIFMANFYYDMSHFRRFTPYIGAGVGFSVNELKRSHSTEFSQCDPNPPFNCDGPTPLGTETGSTGKTYNYSLAAQLTAGVTYRISERTAFDFNYRYLYVDGTDVRTTIGADRSTIDIADQSEHYVRAGLRWDIR